MSKLLKVIERVAQLVTVIVAVISIVEYIKAYKYRKELSRKAKHYVEEELENEGGHKGKLKVYSPKLAEANYRLKNLFVLLGSGLVITGGLHFINRED